MTKSQKALTICIILVLLGGSLYLGWLHRHRALPSIVPSVPAESVTDTTNHSADTDTTPDYGLFVQTQFQAMNNYVPKVHYRDAGLIPSGQYAGYHRIVGFLTEDGPGGPSGFTFATKDYSTFILDSNTYPYNSYSTALGDLNSPASMFDKQKVTAVADLPTDFPATVDQGSFVLVRGALIDASPDAGASTLASPVPGLTFSSSAGIAGGSSPDQPEEVKKGFALASLSTDLKAADASGLVYAYAFITKEMYARRQKLAQDNYDPTAYQDFYIGSDLHIGAAHYSVYGQFAPGGCGAAGSSYVLSGVSDADFIPVGTTAAGLPLYKPSDVNSPLYQAEYYRKIGVYKDYDYFLEMNHLASAPSYEEYAAKNPVLLFKDAWGRFVVLGEVEYEIPGGCGKPVIYLYPTAPTAVSVAFANPVMPDRAIPAYAGGWNVEAYPDGTLKDLQPKATDCSAISYALPGADYAKDACPLGTYPYIYWSGSASGAYPKQDAGWIIARGDVASFLDATLSDMGLSDKEKSDMTSYWVPALLSKNAPYYRISFIQTKEMNAFIPMKVTPAPDATFRIFLDWQPLAEKPKATLVPEKLDHLDRAGFTLVEWGGLRQ